MYLKCTNLMPILFKDESKIQSSSTVVLMIRCEKSYVIFLPTLKIEGATDVNFKRVPSILRLGKTPT